jgi:hypothetical protein
MVLLNPKHWVAELASGFTFLSISAIWVGIAIGNPLQKRKINIWHPYMSLHRQKYLFAFKPSKFQQVFVLQNILFQLYHITHH